MSWRLDQTIAAPSRRRRRSRSHPDEGLWGSGSQAHPQRRAGSSSFAEPV